MNCLQCGNRLPLLRKFGSGGEFCSEAHRQAFIREQEALALSRLIDAQQRSQQATRKAEKEKEKKKAAKDRKSTVEAVALMNPVVEPPGIVEWSWHGLRKEPGNFIEPEPGMVRPRAAVRFVSILGSPGQVGLDLTIRGGKPVTPRAARFPGIDPVGPNVSAAALASLGSARLSLGGVADAPPAEDADAAEPELPREIPPAELVPWTPTIDIRSQAPVLVAIEAAGAPLRLDWTPDAFPHARLSPDSGRLFTNVPAVEDFNRHRLFPVVPFSRPIPPSPAAAPLEPADFEVKGTIPPLGVRPSARLPQPSHNALSLSQPAVADMQVVVRIAAPVDFSPTPASPPIRALAPPSLQVPAKVEIPIIQAQWGNRLVDAGAVPLAPGTGCLRPKATPFAAIDFQPPLFPLRLLRLYPKGSGQLRDWRIQIPNQPIPPLVDGAVVLNWRARPICDWVPVMARLFALAYDDTPRQSPSRLAQGFDKPGEDDQTSGASGGGPILPDHRGALSGQPEPDRPNRQFPLPIEKIVPAHGGIHPRALLAPDSMEPQIVFARCAVVPVTPELAPSPFAEGLAREVAGRVQGLWDSIPSIAKWGTLALAVALTAATILPRNAVSAPKLDSGSAVPSLATGWSAIQRNIMERAAISLTDDFRNGLSDWEGDDNWAQHWSYDSSGFVRTGPLALLTPSRGLHDYRMEFLGQIERQSLGWVVRARDTRNYHAIKLAIVEPGPVPVVAIQRYAVINGKAGPVRQKRLPLAVRTDTMYRVVTEVRGENYSLMVQDTVVDSWTEDRLTSGGVGLFSAKGAQARVRWVGVWHQYDTLGRLCALLAPHGLPGTEREE